MADPIETLEIIANIIRGQLPYASDEQIADAFVANSSEIAAIMVSKLEKEFPAIIEKLDLPPDSRTRMDYRRKLERAKRSREGARTGIIEEAESTKKLVTELRMWQRDYAEIGLVQQADDYANSIADFQKASTTKEQILAHFENDLTGNIINREGDIKEKDRKVILKLEELIHDSTQR